MTACRRCGTEWTGARMEHCAGCHETFGGTSAGEQQTHENDATRDDLVKAIRMGVVAWNTLGSRKVGEDVSQFLADWLIENACVIPPEVTE